MATKFRAAPLLWMAPLLCMLLLVLPRPAHAQPAPLHGTIRIWGHGSKGHDYIDSLMRALEDGFRVEQPGINFDNQLHGTASAIGALYTGTADIALMGREIWPMEVTAYQEVKHHPPVAIDILTGSLDIRNKEFALVVFANRANPVAHLTLGQMARVFGGEHPVATWGELGATGAWAAHPVHVYGFEIHRGFGYFLEQRVFGGSAIWNPDLKELSDVRREDGTLLDAGQRIVDAVAADPDGIGYSSLLYKNPEVKPLALAASAGAPYVAPTLAGVRDHSYPLFSGITCFIDRTPGRPVDPKLAAFFRFILGPRGAAIVDAAGGYMPLPPQLARLQLRKLR